MRRRRSATTRNVTVPKSSAPTQKRRAPDVEKTDGKVAKRKRSKGKQPGGEGGATAAKSRGAQKKAGEKRTAANGRTVRFREQPSAQTAERIQRALPGSAHRMFLITRQQLQAPGSSPDGGAEELTVLGATGNVYTVCVSRHTSCTCPDFRRGNLCKHLFFVLLRVFRLNPSNPLLWQAALLPSEVDALLRGEESCGRGQAPGVAADAAVREQFRKLQSGAAGEEASPEGPARTDGECGICFDALQGDARPSEKLATCSVCRNCLHQQCFDKWRKQCKTASPTCPYCRSPWPEADGVAAAAGQKGTKTAFGRQYINLAQHSAAHRSGDTSWRALYGNR